MQENQGGNQGGGGDDQYAGRESQFPDTMGSLISAFSHNVNQGYQEMQMTYADYILKITAMDNLEWATNVGILTMEQKLTLLQSVPITSIVGLDQFGYKEAELSFEMRVSATQEKKSSLAVSAGTESELKVGGMAALFGAGGSVKVKADTTYTKDTRRASDYSSTMKGRLTMERFPPPEGVQKLIDAQNEVVSSAMLINKQIIEKQYGALETESDDAEVPIALPAAGTDTEDTPATPASDVTQ